MGVRKMSFEMIKLVDYLEEADFAEKIHVGDSKEPVTEEYALRLASATAKIWVENKIVQAALAEAEKFKGKKTLKDYEPIPKARKNSVIFCSRREMFVTCGNDLPVPREQIYATAHTKLTDKTIVLRLKDFASVATCSFGPSRDPVPMDPKFVLRREIRIKLNLEALEGIVYKRVIETQERQQKALV